MSSRDPTDSSEPTRRHDTDAAAWIGQLRADDRTSKVDAAFRKWLNADPRHRNAFEHADRMLEAARTLPPSIRSRYPSWQSVQLRRRTWRLSAAFVALLLVAGVVMFYGQRHRGVETAVGELRTLTLADGSRVTLNTATHLTVSFDERIRRVNLVSGEASFEVAKNPQRPFIVRAGDREVTALGTSFVVRLDAERTAVTLVEGKVSVTPVPGPGASLHDDPEPVHPASVLHPGERLTIAAGRPQRLDRPALETVTAWQRGKVVFRHTGLPEAVEEMNRYSERKVAIEGSGVSGFSISGIFRAGDQENFALALRDTYSLRLRSEADRIVLTTLHGSE